MLQYSTFFHVKIALKFTLFMVQKRRCVPAHRFLPLAPFRASILKPDLKIHECKQLGTLKQTQEVERWKITSLKVLFVISVNQIMFQRVFRTVVWQNCWISNFVSIFHFEPSRSTLNEGSSSSKVWLKIKLDLNNWVQSEMIVMRRSRKMRC